MSNSRSDDSDKPHFGAGLYGKKAGPSRDSDRPTVIPRFGATTSNAASHTDEIDELSGLPVREILAKWTWRYLSVGEKIRQNDQLWHGPHSEFVTVGRQFVGQEVKQHDRFARALRLESGLYRWLDRGELIRGGDQWLFGRQWRPCEASAGEHVVRDRHLRRRVDGQAHNLCHLQYIEPDSDRIFWELGIVTLDSGGRTIH